MTVRMVVTASGRVQVDGTGYEPEGGVTRASARPGDGPPRAIDGPLRIELERALAVGDRANNAVLQEHDGRWTVQGDPTEGALIVAARKAGLEDAALDARFRRIGEVPFSSERKIMTTVHADSERRERLFVFSKGAPDVLLARCSHELEGEALRPLTDARRVAIRQANEALARDALRTLGVAFRSLPAAALDGDAVDERVEHDLVFAGLIGMIDPPRAEAVEAVARAKAAGIRPMMMTGDHPVTAAVIAAELGIGSGERAVTGIELEKMPDDALKRTVRDVSVYARVNPEHKLRIVRALQRDGAIVAMTGDGVNDAPALKTADIGVAMGITGTDVSKEAADIVLADDNFATIVAAVEEGRTVFSNIRSFLRYLLSSNMGEVLTVFLGVVGAGVIGLHGAGTGEALVLPLLATQILWINLVTDSGPALAMGVDRPSPDLMERPPRRPTERAIDAQMWRGVLAIGLVMALATLLTIDLHLPGGLIEGTDSLDSARTAGFTVLVLAQLFNCFNARSETDSAFSGLFGNRWLWTAVAVSIVLQVAVVHVELLNTAFGTVPLSMTQWAVCVAMASTVLWFSEVRKAWLRR